MFPLFLFVLVLLCAAFRYGAKESFPTALPLFLLLAFFLGIIRYEWHEDNWRDFENEASLFSQRGALTLVGTVDGVIRYNSKYQQVSFPIKNVSVSLENRKHRVGTKLQISTYGPLDATPQFGDWVECEGSVEPIRAMALPGQVDHKAYLASEGIHARVRIFDPSQIRLIHTKSKGLGVWLQRTIFSMRQHILKTYRQHLDAPWGDLLASLFLGERAELPTPLRQSLLNTGLYHVTSVSGLHTTVLVGSLLFALKMIGFRRKQIALLAVPMLLVFLSLVGWKVPAMRASILAVGILAGLLFDRDVDALNLLGVAALITLVTNPTEAFLPGFQLSYTAVFFIFVLTPRLQRLLPMRPMGLNYLWKIASACLCAWMGLIPILAWHFGTLHWLTIPANLAAMPLVWLCTVSGGVLALAGFIGSWVAIPVAWVAQRLLMCLGVLVDWFAGFPLAAIRIPRPGWQTVVGYYGVIFVLFAKREHIEIALPRFTLRRLHIALAIVLVVVIVGGFFGGAGTLRVHFLALGSDCILIQAPGSGVLLIDGGAPDKSGSSGRGPRLLEALSTLRIRRIDCLVLTHADSDHVGELKSVVENLPVRTFVTSPVAEPTGVYSQLLGALQERNVPIRYAVAGDRIEGFPNLSLEVVSPGDLVLSRPKVEDNDASVVIRASYGEFDVLLTGDIPDKVERLLLDEPFTLEAEILKVAHHGSKHSSSKPFLQRVSPEVAVIQVGRNPYGHPHPDAVARLSEICDLVMRTDLDGTIEVESNGSVYWVRDACCAKW